MGVDYLSTFYPEKLSVQYVDGVSSTEPLMPRRYTLTHSDITGELFLNIGMNYAWEKIKPMRDEVLGEWKCHGDFLYFCVYLHVDQGQFTPSVSAKRNEVFRRELPLALTAIRYGDQIFFNTYPQLDQLPSSLTFCPHIPSLQGEKIGGPFKILPLE